MTADPYSSVVRALFSSPGHVGEAVDGASAYFSDQGLAIRLSARVVDGVITELRFRARACPHVIAAAEWFCGRFEGGNAEELEHFETSQIMEHLAVPIEKTGRILVLEDTVKSLRAAILDRDSN